MTAVATAATPKAPVPQTVVAKSQLKQVTAKPIMTKPIVEASNVVPAGASPEEEAIFMEAWNRCDNEVPFKKEWSNGTGMYDNAIIGEDAPKIRYGVMFKSITPSGRRLFVIGTRLGNVVIFEYNISEKKDAKPVYMYQSGSNFKQGGWFVNDVLGEVELELALGTDILPHIGRRIEVIHSAMKKT